MKKSSNNTSSLYFLCSLPEGKAASNNLTKDPVFIENTTNSSSFYTNSSLDKNPRTPPPSNLSHKHN